MGTGARVLVRYDPDTDVILAERTSLAMWKGNRNLERVSCPAFSLKRTTQAQKDAARIQRIREGRLQAQKERIREAESQGTLYHKTTITERKTRNLPISWRYIDESGLFYIVFNRDNKIASSHWALHDKRIAEPLYINVNHMDADENYIDLWNSKLRDVRPAIWQWQERVNCTVARKQGVESACLFTTKFGVYAPAGNLRFDYKPSV